MERPRFDFDGAWLHKYGLMIHIIYNPAAGERSDDVKPAPQPPGLAHQRPGRGRAAAGGEAAVAFGRNVADGGVGVFFQDPDGNHIEIGTYPPTPAFVTFQRGTRRK